MGFQVGTPDAKGTEDTDRPADRTNGADSADRTNVADSADMANGADGAGRSGSAPSEDLAEGIS